MLLDGNRKRSVTQSLTHSITNQAVSEPWKIACDSITNQA